MKHWFVAFVFCVFGATAHAATFTLTCDTPLTQVSIDKLFLGFDFEAETFDLESNITPVTVQTDESDNSTTVTIVTPGPVIAYCADNIAYMAVGNATATPVLITAPAAAEIIFEE